MLHVRSLAKDVIKYLLDNIISGNITEDHIQGFKKSSVDSTLKCTEKYCDMCDKKFTTEQGLKLHKAYMDEKLGPYVRRNINAYIVENFSYFESHISFPHTQRIGAQRVTFKNKSEYLKFLKEDEKVSKSLQN